MGLSCQISLNRPSKGHYIPGDTVSGVIKYATSESKEYSRITTSLKGKGYLKVIEKTRDSNQNKIFTNKEVYIDEDHIYEEGKFEIEPKPYELEFNFHLPQNLPPSYEIRKLFNKNCTVTCKIQYYIRIKFEMPSVFQFAKHFKKEIVIAPGIVPKLNMEPVTYEEQRKLVQFFKKKPSFVDMKVTITNSVIPAGGKIELKCEVNNDTNINIKTIKTKLKEVEAVKLTGAPKLIYSETVPGSDSNSLAVNSGETQVIPVEIFIPPYLHSIENSTIVSKDYIVKVTAELPMPYRNIKLDIPIQIGSVIERYEIEDDSPPSYWEAMGETKDENDFDEK